MSATSTPLSGTYVADPIHHGVVAYLQVVAAFL